MSEVNISASAVKELREQTGVGMMDCKKALVEAEGDFDKAIELLRLRGQKMSEKRADRDAKEGVVIAMVSDDNKRGVVVRLSCETDFVSRNETFEAMLSHFIDIRKASATDEEAITKAEDLKASEYTLKVGENMQIRTLTKIEGDVIASYVHSNFKNGAVVVAKTGTNPDNLKQVAMHVVASNPQVLSPSDISEDIVTKEKDIQLAMMKEDPKNAGKPEEILTKIIEGKMTKFREENALLTQPFVVNPDVKVGDFIGKDAIVAFYRYTI